MEKIKSTIKKPMDCQDFYDKVDCIVRNIEDNSKVNGQIKGGTVKDLGEVFKAEYRKLRNYKKEWRLPKPMKSSSLKR